MPMIDVYAVAGTFADKHQLAADLARALMTIEQVPDIPMFRKNTAAFIHELPNDALSNVEGDNTYVRVQVLTNAGALDRPKQLAVVEQFHKDRRGVGGRPNADGANVGPGVRSPRWGVGSGRTCQYQC